MNEFFVWLEEPGREPALFSLVLLGALAGLYFLFRRRIAEGQGTAETKRFRRIAVGLGLVLIGAASLLAIWREDVGFAGRLDAALRDHAVYGSLLYSAVAAVLVYLTALGTRYALLRSVTNIDSRHKIRRAVFWSGWAGFLVAAVFIWGRHVGDVGVFLGIMGAGLALSMQEILLCVAGWGLIVVQRPFDIGDRIEVDGRVGDVIDVGVILTAVLEVGHWVQADQSTGRILHIPNSSFIRHASHNYTKGFPFVWNEIEIVVTFESDWQRARDIILAQAEAEAAKAEAEVSGQIRAMQGRYAIHYERLTPIVYTRIAAHGVGLTLRHLTPVRKRRSMEHRVSEGILAAFAQETAIDFAYPTTRLYRNPEEGKPGTGGPGEDASA